MIAQWVERTTGLAPAAILWDAQNQPSPELPYVGLVRRDFPLDGDDEETIREVTTSATLTCTATGVGSSISIVLFGHRYAYTLTAGQDATDGRDALLALLAPDLVRVVVSPSTANEFGVGFQPCTAVASGAAAINFTGLGFGPVRLEVIEGGTLTQTRAYRSIAKGLRRALVRVELFWPEQHVAFQSADAYAGALRDSLLEGEPAQWLAERGVGVEQAQRIRVQDVSAVAGGALRETRLIFDVLFNASSVRYRAPHSLDVAVPPAIVALPPTEI